jgi:peptidoglycan-associated lipoprotein
MTPNPTPENASMNLFRPSTTARLSVVATLAMAALLAGCASDVKLDKAGDVPVETRNTAATPKTGADANANAANQSSVASVDLSKSEAAQMMANLPKIIYFDFDSFVVKDDFKPVVEANAKALTADRKRHVAVEGHTDERGGREYNLALGQRRAEAVAKSLTLLGVGGAQVEAVSFGKERPAVQGGGEEAWAKNRRVELKDK